MLLEGKTAELPVIVSARLLSSNLSRTFNVALHSLIELHDYLIPVATQQVGEGGDGGGPTKPPQQALLSLSQLHEGYGHIGHAMEALMEAVDVDQGSGDGESLVTCLMQLCALMRAAPPSESAHSQSPAAMMQVWAPSLLCRSRVAPSTHVASRCQPLCAWHQLHSAYVLCVYVCST
jgi:hypothetical protein